MPAPKQTPRNFPEILEYIWWKLDRALDEHGIELSAAVGALDAARSGTTTLIDHHASPNFIDGSLDILAGTIGKVGLRSVLCYEVTDRGGKQRREAGIRENERFLRDRTFPLAGGVVGAHASFTLENETLEELAGLAERFQTGVHIHVAEDRCDEEDSMRRCGMRTALRLSEAGLLRHRSIAAHGVHLDAGEIETLQSDRTWLVHNCRSNMNNGVGRAPVLAFGERCALGTDGIDQDMFSEARTAYFRGREDTIDLGADRFTDLLARGGLLASQFFPNAIGNLDVGSSADLIVLEYDPPTPLTQENLAWHWMFAMTARHVESVMVEGNWVIYRREFRTVDEEGIRAKAREEARRIWDRMDAL
jgi:putative selenium metabolism protein SsnA